MGITEWEEIKGISEPSLQNKGNAPGREQGKLSIPLWEKEKPMLPGLCAGTKPPTDSLQDAQVLGLHPEPLKSGGH